MGRNAALVHREYFISGRKRRSVYANDVGYDVEIRVFIEPESDDVYNQRVEAANRIYDGGNGDLE